MDGHSDRPPQQPWQWHLQPPPNHNFTFQSPNTTAYYQYHGFSNPSFVHHQWQHQYQQQQYQLQQQQQQQRPPSQNPSVPPLNQPPQPTVATVDAAAVKARTDLRAAGESVSAWKVTQAALSALKVDSWGSLGFLMQQVPSLNSIIIIEGKINAFIHCFVAAQRLTTLYDMEVEFCKNEGVESFDELGFGPLVRHPLVQHYFSLSSDDTEFVKISTLDTMQLLRTFMRITSKKIEVDEFLDFVAKKRKVSDKLKLGIRVQNFGNVVKTMREVMKLDDPDMEKHKEVVRPKNKARKNRPLFTSLKKELDERFNSISQRVESFTSVKKDFCGKHTRFGSSSSEDEQTDALSDEDDSDYGKISQTDFSAQSAKNSDRASSCPYPSATEEMARLGVKAAIDLSSASGGPKHHSCQAVNRKRAREELNSNNSAPAPSKLRKMNNAGFDAVSSKNDIRFNEDSSRGEGDFTSADEDEFCLTDDSLRLFIEIWKERCRGVSVGKVLKRMLRFYRIRRRKKMNELYSSYPFIGVLNVAISSIKLGIWDSIYDTVQGVSHHSKTLISDACEYECIDVEPSAKDARQPIFDHAHAVSAEDIIKKVAAYMKLDHGVLTNDKSILENRFSILRKLFNCEHWLAEQFCVKEFKSLGYGDFLLFMEKYASLLPQELHSSLTSNTSQKSPLEVCMMHHQLVILLSQALNNVWENRSITKRDVSSLLMRQFPCIGFKVVADCSLNDFLSEAMKDKNFETSKSVVFSLTVCPTTDTPESSDPTKNEPNSTLVRYESDRDTGTHETVTSKDAVTLLLKAPMLIDLNLWSHWDLNFAPSLGPLVPWLLKEVKTDELLCLVTRDGKVLRIDPSATADSFLEAAIQGSSFQTAVELLSLYAVAGGQKHFPVSLLKCHVQHAFNVILKNSLENDDLNGCENSRPNMKVSCGDIMTRELTRAGLSCELQNNLGKMNISVSAISRFILDCLHYLPAEICVFAADIFLSGMQSIAKDAASAILSECSQMSQLLMLHEVGLSLGVVEWINDYHMFCTKDIADLFLSEESCLKPVGSTMKSGSTKKQDVLSTSQGNTDASPREDESRRKSAQVGTVTNKAEVSGDRIGGGNSVQQSRLGQEDAALIIESIRREEFGLDPSISNVESTMLQKQHARLGRALHCLSQELYSQDSHFLLELVQNADDNIYPGNVEPTLTFILQDSSIVVLNNELGFSAQNIAALCDIGNSTKKGSTAGYIGQKGIGFKSVFRITDAPEIHSNGFHVKFDISEGQIGFVLPTVIPPCDLNLFSRLASNGSDQFDLNQWNTCIVLPFRSRLSEGTVMKNIMSMFSDLHPSLLLFLHRLQCIKFRNLLEDSVVLMRKEIVGNGIINVSHGKEKMTWFVISENLRSDFIRPDVQTTEISIAFTLQESADGGYISHLSQQPVFAFLPLRTYGLKFILQGNFVLPSSREEVDGNSPWNQWLLSEFPGLFVKAERSFCSLSCFKENTGKAVAAFMSFVPLVGEVHGFFSSLPRMIISKLRMSKCLLLEGDNSEWVPPCKVLRGWSEQAYSILPRALLHQHLGLGFLDKSIVLSDALARALGVEEYGPKVLIQFLSSLCCTKDGTKSMGLGWLSTYLAELYSMLELFPGRTVLDSEVEMGFVDNLKRIPFIPLSNGTFSSINEGTIWIQSDSSSSSSDGEHKIESFPNLFAKLRIVSPALLSVPSVDELQSRLTISDKLTTMLHKIGVQRLSAHEIIKVHILPAVSDDSMNKDKKLMTEYVCFVMSHLHSSCHDCHVEKEAILSELKNKAYILTNYGFKRPAEVFIHFSMEFGNPVDAYKLIDSLDIKWHEVDTSYLNHPITKALPSGLTKWREFFQGIGLTDFVKVVQVEKTVAAISRAQFKSLMLDAISLESTVTDWESPELVNLLFMLSRDGNKRSCEYLLEVFDKLWDSCFSDKTTGYYNSKSVASGKLFKSSFICTISDTQWVVSTMDNKLHHPRDLYYDCDAVRSVLGASAPYAVPKVKNEKLVGDIGFKTTVTLEDVIAMLKEWSSKTMFMASLTQMSKLYTFIWNEVAASKKFADELQCGPYIFVPFKTGSSREDVVSGRFLSPHEVYWRDTTGAIDQTKEAPPKSSKGITQSPLNKTLCKIYPSLRDFFVNACGVREDPPLSSYLKILLQLSKVVLPSQAAKSVFQVFLKWTDGLKGLSPEDVVYLKNCLKKEKYAVLPTKQDKWVSMHHSYGLICWFDDKKLKKHFKHMEGINFLYFGKLSKDEEEIFQTKVSVLMKALEIPALSEVVSREAVHNGVADSSFKALLVNWALPYAQRYLNAMHPDKYSQIKLSGSDSVSRLRVVAVQQLFYRNVIKGCVGKSDKRTECSCLLQDNILYTTQKSDAHALFLELSRLFFSGNPDLHMANFLHMITTMAESGSNEEQTEFFILNSQKIPKLPDGESVWSLPPVLPAENEETDQTSRAADGQSSSNKRKAQTTLNWPPADWKAAPGFSYARSHGFRTRASISQPSYSALKQNEDEFENIERINNAEPIPINSNWTIEDDSRPALPDSSNLARPWLATNYEADQEMAAEFNPIGLESAVEVSNLGSAESYKKGQIRIGAANEQAVITGRVGENLAFKFFAGKYDTTTVTWVNKDKETGLPYDILVKDEKNGKVEYIEVKSTISQRKNWLMITLREWQFAVEKGDAFSIAHVVLTNNNVAKVSVFNNPVRLLEQRRLRLVVVMPTEQDFALVS